MNIKIHFTPILLTSLMILLGLPFAQAQVWPGDVNGNGHVNNVDLIYLGYLFGETGPTRFNESIEWAEHPLPVEWIGTFPNGMNYAHADCNGDGTVDIEDVLAIFINYDLQNDGYIPDFFETGIQDIDPPIRFDPSQIPSAQALGSTLTDIPIILGSEDFPVNDLVSIAFTITYNSDFVQDNSFSIIMDSSWVNTSVTDIFFGQTAPEDGRVEIGMSRYGLNPVNGNGPIARVSIIIEDNLLGLEVGDTTDMVFCIEDIKLIDVNLQEIPVVPDCLEIGVFDSETTNTRQPKNSPSPFKVYPNPASEWIEVWSENRQSIDGIRLLDPLGQVLFSKTRSGEMSESIDLGNLVPGVYFLQIEWEGKTEVFKFVKQ